jgi:hypothetical protein
VFVTDKKVIKLYGLKDKPNRIKKLLMKEISAVLPGDRVLFLGTTSDPQVYIVVPLFRSTKLLEINKRN